MAINLEVLKSKVANKLVALLIKYRLPEEMLSRKATFICSRNNLQKLISMSFRFEDMDVINKCCNDILFLYTAQGEITTALQLKVEIEKLDKAISDKQIEQNQPFDFNSTDIKEVSSQVPDFHSINKALDYFQDLKNKGAIKKNWSWAWSETKDEAFARQVKEYTENSRKLGQIIVSLLAEKEKLSLRLAKCPESNVELQKVIEKLAKDYDVPSN